MEIRAFPLTNSVESRKVNGVRVSETRINPEDARISSGGEQESGAGPQGPKHAGAFRHCKQEPEE